LHRTSLTTKCGAKQGSRLIIVAVQLGAVKIYVAAVEALRKKERHDETQFTTKIELNQFKLHTE
jgi:hypothetical protein